MKTILRLLLFTCVLYLVPVFVIGQTDFRAGYRAVNPAPRTERLSFEEKVPLHKAFLKEAQREEDKLKELYGFLYLFSDHIQALDYEKAANYLLEAETIARTANEPGWIGFTMLMKATLYAWMLKDEEALGMYKEAIQYCREADDRLCLTESMEQLAATYAQLDSFAQAEYYFEQAIPVMRANDYEEALAPALNNYGILLLRQHKADEAISYFEQAMALNEKNGEVRDLAQNLNNLADAYYCREDLDLAIETYEKCIELNTQQGFLENMVTNFIGLYEIYKDKEDYKTANEFLIKHYELHDSLAGIQLQERVAELEAQYESQQKEIDLQKREAALVATQRSLERWVTAFFLVILLIGVGVWRWRLQTRLAQQEMAQNQENLHRMTKLLVEKNTRLAKLEKQLAAVTAGSDNSSNVEEFEENLYDQRILTEEDWASFKVYFEKTYPGYIQRLRSTDADLSEAEERLFLFIKLNLTSKEIAAILGISPDSVKKTRQRLRKRLELEQETSLNAYVQNF